MDGGMGARVARRNGMSLGLLYYWRRCARQELAPSGLSFVPILPAAAEGAVAAATPPVQEAAA